MKQLLLRSVVRVPATAWLALAAVAVAGCAHTGPNGGPSALAAEDAIADAPAPSASAPGEAGTALTGMEWFAIGGAPALLVRGAFPGEPTLFSLTEPVRIVADFPGAVLAEDVEAPPAGAVPGVVDVAVGQYEVATGPLVRMVVTLDRPATASARRTSGGTLITFGREALGGEGSIVEVPATASVSDDRVEVLSADDGTVRMAVARDGSAPVEATGEAEALDPIDARLEGVTVERDGDGANLVLTFDRAVDPARVRTLALVEPNRLVLDLPGARTDIRLRGVPGDGQRAGQVRIGRHDDKVRLVVDLAGQTPLAVTLRADDRRVVAALGVGEPMVPYNGPAGTALAEAPAAAPQVVAQGGEPASAGAELTTIQFANDADVTRIRLGFSAVPSYDVIRDQRLYTLRLPGVRVPGHLEQTLDTRDFQSAVDMVSVFNAEDGGAQVVVGLGEAVPQSVTVEGRSLVWSFDRPAVARGEESDGYAGAISLGSDGETTINFEAMLAPAEVMPNGVLPGTRAAAPRVAQDSGRSIEIRDERMEQDLQRQQQRLIEEGQTRYTGQRISLDLRMVPIHDVLRIIAEVANVNIIADDNVGGSVTVRLIEVPWDLALDIVLRAKALGYVRDGGGRVIRVARRATLDAEEDRRFELRMIQLYSAPLKVYIIPVNYSTAQELVGKVRSVLSPRGEVDFDPRTNMLIVRDIENFAQRARQLVEQLDLQTPQVVIECRIVEANIINSRGVGIQWGFDVLASTATGNPTGLSFPSSIAIGGAGDPMTAQNPGVRTTLPLWVVNAPVPGGNSGIGFRFGNVANTANIDLRLSALESEGYIKIVSSPRVTTMDNSQAIIRQGQTFPVISEFQENQQGVIRTTSTVTKIETGIRLEVTPHITLDRSVILNVRIEKKDPDFSTQIRGVPTILEKEAVTQILVRSGDTAVIGGIYSYRTNRSAQGVPGLMHVPILGWLFKFDSYTEEKTELLIFITPHIAVSDAQASGDREL